MRTSWPPCRRRNWRDPHSSSTARSWRRWPGMWSEHSAASSCTRRSWMHLLSAGGPGCSARRRLGGSRSRSSPAPPEEQQEPFRMARHRELVGQLEAVGCRVEFRDRMHEKVLILDGSVLWHGSKNLLANIGPTDLMMRYTDPASCDRVRRLMERTRMEHPARGLWRPARETAPASEMPAQRAEAQDGEVYPGLVRDGRLYLDVPYEQRNEAKRLFRAQWDKEARHWWVDADRIPREQAARWLP
ncbi:DUF5710 domain-containing protein [Streptomyces sp. CL12]|uniref:DUF5710 domain-containing protein n=1 Tax=Streptomyces sp. CL12 TaxID=3391744 RepID=UPI003A80F991